MIVTLVPTLSSDTAQNPDLHSSDVGSFADDMLLLLSLLSIVLILAKATTLLSVFWTDTIYVVDFMICVLFAADFGVDLGRAQSKRDYLKTRWYELFAMVPAYLFVSLSLPILIAAVLRALWLWRFALGIRLKGGQILDRRKKRRLDERHLLGYIAAAILIALFVVLFRDPLSKFQPYGSYILNILISAIIIAAALAVAEIIVILGVSRIDDLQTRDTIERVVLIAIVGLAAIVIASFIFKEILIVFGTLGVVGIILSFSLSPVIGNFIGWVFISTQRPFSLGDRIVLGNANGIVKQINYLTTTLQEVGGDPPASSVTGGCVTIPNSLMLSSAFSTYKSAALGMTNSLVFEIGYESDLRVVKQIIEGVVKSNIQKVLEAPEIKGTSEAIELSKAQPQVTFSPSQTWIIARIVYPIVPSKADSIRTQIVQEIVKEFNANPDKVKYPKGDSR